MRCLMSIEPDHIYRMKPARFALLLLLTLASASPAAESGELEKALRAFAASQAPALPGKTSLEVARLPESPKIAACKRWQVSLPDRARFWGQVSLGAQCLDGSQQSLYVSARVRIDGTAIVASRHIASGQTIASDDLTRLETDLGSFPPDLMLDPASIQGRVSRTAIAPGRPILKSQLRQEQVIEAGQSVRIELVDGALAVSNEGVAISSAAAGQSVRVKLEGGRIITGTATEDGRVEIRP